MRELSMQEVEVVNGAWICTPYTPSGGTTCTNNGNGASLSDALYMAGYPGAA